VFAPAPERKILRRMNYISDQQGILRRYLREEGGWNSHLDHCSEFILRILKYNATEQLVVLGSGWLLDFPVEKILPLVKKVYLVDVHFPPQILKKAENSDKIECVNADITGGLIKNIYDKLGHSKKNFQIPEFVPKPVISKENGKLVISLNIMNQLDILIIDYIRKNIELHDADILKLRKNIQDAHLQMLSENAFILISDYREILMNSKGKILEERDLIFSQLPSGDETDEWEWSFDTHRLYNAHADTIMKVKAIFSKA